jgi:RNA polymerase sigma-70 factor (ECF subfamily)
MTDNHPQPDSSQSNQSQSGISASHADSTETSLIVRVQQNDADAWRRLTQLYGPMIYGWGRRAGLQPDDAADIMQTVFVALTHRINRFQRRSSRDSFRGWLWTVTRNKVNDHYRHLQAQAAGRGGTDAQNMMQALAESPPSSASVEGQQEINSLWRRAIQLVQGEFEGRTWIAFWRTAVEGDAPKDVAADMKISVWAVYKARTRVLQRLREEFQGLLE